MKTTLLFLCFFCLQNGFSQNIKGKVMANNLPIAQVEVINMSSKEVINTNAEGVFEINASKGNWITFYHKNYDVEKIYVDSLFNFNAILEIKLSEKTIKIEEVVVEKKQPFLKGLNTAIPVIPDNKPNVKFNDGTVDTPVDFMAIGKLIGGLFKNKDKVEIKEKIPVQFKTFTAQSYSNEFLVNSLKIQPEEIEAFLNFCSFDPKSKESVAYSDKLILLQYLIVKSEEYKKVNQKE